MRRVSRNAIDKINIAKYYVTPRMRRVSRNDSTPTADSPTPVTPRMRRVSRNCRTVKVKQAVQGHASHEACE